MSLAYPIADTAHLALESDGPLARTRREATTAASANATLETEWIRLPAADFAEAKPHVERARNNGYVQVYEGERDITILAVTYWKPDRKTPLAPSKPPAKKRSRSSVSEGEGTALQDHADDLYFRHGRTRKRRRAEDPNQLDLFTRPDARGDEHPDPNNPNIMLTDEEGDGTTFGGSSD